MQQPAIRGAGNRLTGRHITIVSFAAQACGFTVKFQARQNCSLSKITKKSRHNCSPELSFNIGKRRRGGFYL